MKKFITNLLFTVLLIHPLLSQENSQWRGPNRNGIYPDENLLKEWPEKGPELLWSKKDIGVGYATVAVLSDKVITIGTLDSINYLYGFDHSGKEIYKIKIGHEWMVNFPGNRSTPIIHDGLGYFLNALGKLFCFDSNNGKIKWEKDILKDYDGVNPFYGITENLLIDGDFLFCTPGGEKSNVIALNRKTGDLIWKSEGCGEKTAYGSPVIIDRDGIKILIVTTFKSVFALDVKNGKLIWKRILDNEPHKTTSRSNLPLLRDNYLFVKGAGKSGGFMLELSKDGKSYKEIWRNPELGSGTGDAILLGDVLYTGSGSRIKN